MIFFNNDIYYFINNQGNLYKFNISNSNGELCLIDQPKEVYFTFNSISVITHNDELYMSGSISHFFKPLESDHEFKLIPSLNGVKKIFKKFPNIYYIMENKILIYQGKKTKKFIEIPHNLNIKKLFTLGQDLLVFILSEEDNLYYITLEYRIILYKKNIKKIKRIGQLNYLILNHDNELFQIFLEYGASDFLGYATDFCVFNKKIIIYHENKIYYLLTDTKRILYNNENISKFKIINSKILIKMKDNQYFLSKNSIDFQKKSLTFINFKNIKKILGLGNIYFLIFDGYLHLYDLKSNNLSGRYDIGYIHKIKLINDKIFIILEEKILIVSYDDIALIGDDINNLQLISFNISIGLNKKKLIKNANY